MAKLSQQASHLIKKDQYLTVFKVVLFLVFLFYMVRDSKPIRTL